MKKTTLYLFLFASLFSKGVAQSILVEYEEKRSQGNTTHYPTYWITDSITIAKHEEVSHFVKKKREGFLYNKEKHLSKTFYVKDSLHNFKWELLPDTATILKRKCMSAKTTFRGREYKVFYTPEIPISDGPWKLGGLPGLILEAKTTDGFVSWRAVKLDLACKEKFQYVDVTKYTYSDWAGYVAKHKEMVNVMIHKLRTAEPMGMQHTVKIQSFSIEIFHPEFQINGIEVECD